MLKDKYNMLQVFLVELGRIERDESVEVKNEKDAIENINKRVFRTYVTADKNGVDGDKRVVMNKIEAESFAQKHELKLINEYQRDKILMGKKYDTKLNWIDLVK